MGIFDRFKKKETQAQAAEAPAAPREGLQDFHPYNTGLEQILRGLRREFESHIPERKACSRDQFLALLAGVPALRKTPGIPGPAESGPDYFTTLPRCASNEDAAACRAHLEKVFGITDKASLLEFCRGNLICQSMYLDFDGVWNGRPHFPLDKLEEKPRQFFQVARDFSAQFYEVTRHQGFLGWDISECMGHLRAGYACGLLSREEFDELAEHWIVQAQCFRDWTQYAVSLMCGELFWDFRHGSKPPELNKGLDLWLRLVRKLLNDENAWGSGLWYVPKRDKEYRLWPSELRDYLTDWEGPDGCLATDHITVLGKPVGWCYREEPAPGHPDSGWRFFSGEEDGDYLSDLSHTEVYTLNTICNYDPGILPLLTAPVGSAFTRDADGKFHAEQRKPPKD